MAEGHNLICAFCNFFPVRIPRESVPEFTLCLWLLTVGIDWYWPMVTFSNKFNAWSAKIFGWNLQLWEVHVDQCMLSLEFSMSFMYESFKEPLVQNCNLTFNASNLLNIRMCGWCIFCPRKIHTLLEFVQTLRISCLCYSLPLCHGLMWRMTYTA